MEKLIYYPGFEVQSKDWLKFALLYIDELNPIIPIAGENYLSPIFRKIQKETDLIKVHRPEYDEGEEATFDAIEIISKVLSNPQIFTRIFRNNNIIELWRNPEFHNYTLFADKFTNSWKIFCYENGFATYNDNGILINNQLGYVYMTLLAHIIAEKRGVSPVTDHKNMHNFAVFVREVKPAYQEKQKIAQAQINLQLPRNLSTISIDDLIKVRNKPGFRGKLSAFQHELNNYLNNIEIGTENPDFAISFSDISREFSGDIANIGVGTITCTLGAWLAVTDPQISNAEYLNSVLVEGVGLLISSVIDIKKTWKNTQSKRFTRKYLGELQRI